MLDLKLQKIQVDCSIRCFSSIVYFCFKIWEDTPTRKNHGAFVHMLATVMRE